MSVSSSSSSSSSSLVSCSTCSMQLVPTATDDSSQTSESHILRKQSPVNTPITPEDLLYPADVHLPSHYDDRIPHLLPTYMPVSQVPFLPSDDVSFAHLFPSTHRLAIRHDDTTLDGNMNLRVETAATSPAVQLFHLRMHDLPDRDFSLRRYSRDSGRQVCSSKRAYARTIRTLPEKKSLFRKRRMSMDSVYAVPPTFLAPTASVNLDFINYARIQVSKKRGSYAFEWWGHEYEWRRVVDKALGTKAFHLVRDETDTVAHIVQDARSPSEVHDEKAAGGWVPPCSMWISEPDVLNALTDVADVIVATGLITLVDECIRTEWLEPPDKEPKLRSVRHRAWFGRAREVDGDVHSI